MEKIMMTVRYVVAGLGAAVVGFGLADAESTGAALQQVDVLAGAVAALAAYGYALFNKFSGK